MLKRGWIIGAFALVAAIALAGWIRKPAEAPAPAYFNPTAVPATWNQPAANFAAPAPYGAAPMVYGSAPVAPQATSAPQQRASTRSYTTNTKRRYVVKKRPFSHSAAIVGGSAGAGAAIGALAGGGKGAAIGAISGGAAGLIYDRATHKKKVPVE